jgi:tetratricopeptide (TPR) repeat protein
MRRVVVGLLIAVAAVAAACAPKPIVVPAVTTPKFPEYIKPIVPADLMSDRANVLFDRGWQFLQAGDFKGAERDMAAALRLSPSFYPVETGLGYLELVRRNPAQSLTDFDRVIAREPTYVPALVGRGEALVELKHEDEAIPAFEAALAVDSQLTDIRRRLEVLKFRGVERSVSTARDAATAGRLDDAERAYQTAIASTPDTAFLYRELGAVQRRKGEGEQALATLRTAVQLDPTDAGSLEQIGELLEAAGNRDAALDAYNRSLAIEGGPAAEARRDALVAEAERAKLPEEYRSIEATAQLTRGELAALIGVRLGPALQALPASNPEVMTDVRTHWAEPWIIMVTRAGVMEPFANHTFQPRGVVRRIDFAQSVSRLLPAVASPAQLATWRSSRTRFSDLAETHLLYPAASLVVAADIMPVVGDRAFQPSRAVTGAEAIQTLDRVQALTAAARRTNTRR